MKNGLNVFSMLVILLFSKMLLAGVYKWTDEKGHVHYDDQPTNQPGTQHHTTELDIEIRKQSGITHSSAKKEKRDRMIQVLEEDRHEREQKRKKYYAEKNKRLKRCASLKDRLRRYHDANSVYKLDKSGERRYYSNEERARKESALKKQIHKNCS